MRVIRQLLELFLALIVTVAAMACTSTKAVETSEGGPVTEETCFNVRDVRSFDAIDDRFVYLRCLRGKHYLLTMEAACLGLQNSLAVAVASGFNRVCSHDRAGLTYRDFDRTARCGILRIEAIDDRAAATMLVKRRTRPETETEE